MTERWVTVQSRVRLETHDYIAAMSERTGMSISRVLGVLADHACASGWTVEARVAPREDQPEQPPSGPDRPAEPDRPGTQDGPEYIGPGWVAGMDVDADVL